nr:MAG TPA: hypothetical protein [Caudoviricetes sp.]
MLTFFTCKRTLIFKGSEGKPRYRVKKRKKF